MTNTIDTLESAFENYAVQPRAFNEIEFINDILDEEINESFTALESLSYFESVNSDIYFEGFSDIVEKVKDFVKSAWEAIKRFFAALFMASTRSFTGADVIKASEITTTFTGKKATEKEDKAAESKGSGGIRFKAYRVLFAYAIVSGDDSNRKNALLSLAGISTNVTKGSLAQSIAKGTGNVDKNKKYRVLLSTKIKQNQVGIETLGKIFDETRVEKIISYSELDVNKINDLVIKDTTTTKKLYEVSKQYNDKSSIKIICLYSNGTQTSDEIVDGLIINYLDEVVDTEIKHKANPNNKLTVKRILKYCDAEKKFSAKLIDAIKQIKSSKHMSSLEIRRGDDSKRYVAPYKDTIITPNAEDRLLMDVVDDEQWISNIKQYTSEVRRIAASLQLIK